MEDEMELTSAAFDDHSELTNILLNQPGDTAEDAARVLEESLLGSTNKRKASHSDGSDFDVPIRNRNQFSKRRRRDDMDDITDELERSVADDNSRTPTPAGRGHHKRYKAKLSDELLQPATKRIKKRKPVDEIGFHMNSGQESCSAIPNSFYTVSELETPLPSAPPSPTPKTVYELFERIPAPKKPAKRVEGTQAMKRVKAVEDIQQKVWLNIARKEIPKVCFCNTGSISFG
jgi:hypothetical protein